MTVTGTAAQEDQLIVLVSDYPGWQLNVDGKAAALQSVNGYLGAKMLTGEHSYEFFFHPILNDIGFAVSVATLAFVLAMLYTEIRWRAR